MAVPLNLASTAASASTGAAAFASSPLLTRILELRDFHADLKTRDIQAVFQPWEDDHGGFKIKWIDDHCVYVIFNDPATAKKAYLARLLHPHPGLKNAPGKRARVRPYDGANASTIIASVQNRPRSRIGGSHVRGASSVSSLASIPEPNTSTPVRRGMHAHSASTASTSSNTGFGYERSHKPSLSIGAAAGLPAKPSHSSIGPAIPGRFHGSVPSASSTGSASASRWAQTAQDPDETVTAPPAVST